MACLTPAAWPSSSSPPTPCPPQAVRRTHKLLEVSFNKFANPRSLI